MSAFKLFFTGIIFSVSSLFVSHPKPLSPASPAPKVEVQASTTSEGVAVSSISSEVKSTSSAPKIIEKKAVPKIVIKTTTPAKESSTKTNVATSTPAIVVSSSTPVAPVEKAKVMVPVSNSSGSTQLGGASADPSQEAQDACDELDEGASCQVGQQMTGACQVRGEFFACFPQ